MFKTKVLMKQKKRIEALHKRNAQLNAKVLFLEHEIKNLKRDLKRKRESL